jgi:hypothetical protein
MQHRLYVYIADGLVVTFQTSLMNDPSPNSSVAPEQLEQEQRIQGSITYSVFGNYREIQARCCSLGPMYLLYILFLQALNQQEPCVEYLSWAVSYFNRLVSVE